MNKKTVMVGAVVIFLAGSILGNFAIKMFKQPPEPSEATQSLIGSPAPTFHLKALDGVREDSSQWLGKIQVINFWGTWCPPCKEEIPTLIDVQERYADRGVQIIGISVQDKLSAVKRYAQDNGINYVLLDGDNDGIDLATQLGNDLGILPYTVLLDRDGRIAYVKYGLISLKTLEREINKLI